MAVRVSGGFGTVYEGMSPSLRARIVAGDAEDAAAAARAERERRARWAESYERAVDAEAWRLAQERGIPLLQARREVGHTPREFIELCSARADLEDVQRNARRRQALRRAGIDPDSGAELEVPQQSDREVEVAARLMRTGDDPASVGRGVRRKWLARVHRGDLR